MLSTRSILLVVVLASFPVRPLAAQVVEFGKPLDDWHLFDFDGDTRTDILALFTDDQGNTTFQIALQQESGNFRKLESVTTPGVVSLALGRFHGGPRRQIAMITPANASLLSCDSDGRLKLGKPVVRTDHLVRTGSDGVPGFWHWASDIDEDGHDDLFLPTDEGIALFYGKGDGKFDRGSVLRIEGSREVSGHSDGFLDFERSYPRPEFEDLDGDGRLDLVWFDEEGLGFRLQKKAREFATVSRFPLPWLSGQDATGVVEQTDITLKDLDGDKRVDLVLAKMRSTEGKITDVQTTLVVLMNRPGREIFARKPDALVRIKGIIGVGPHFADTDGDGHTDLVFGSYGAGISDAIARFLGQVKVEMHIYRGKAKGTTFSSSPDFKYEAKVSTKDFENWGARKSLCLHEDLDGDGVADLFEMTRKGSRHEVVLRAGSKGGGFLEIAEEAYFRETFEDVTGVTFRSLKDDGVTAVIVVRETGFTISSPKR